MKRFNFFNLAILIGTLIFSHTAHASLETWELTATVSPASFTPPSFLASGATVKIDYVIDNQAPYGSAIVSESFDGETSISTGYFLVWTAFFALNDGFSPRNNDNVNFISFNNDILGVPANPTIDQLLLDIQANISGQYLRFDLSNGDSVFASPVSFSQVSNVPLPSSMMMFASALIGIVGIMRSRAAWLRV